MAVATCAQAGVPVMNESGASAATVAGHMIGLMLDFAKRLTENDRRMRRNRGFSRGNLMGAELGGQMLGLIGLGHIGHYVAALAGAFGMTVLGHDPSSAR